MLWLHLGSAQRLLLSVYLGVALSSAQWLNVALGIQVRTVHMEGKYFKPSTISSAPKFIVQKPALFSTYLSRIPFYPSAIYTQCAYHTIS